MTPGRGPEDMGGVKKSSHRTSAGGASEVPGLGQGWEAAALRALTHFGGLEKSMEMGHWW